MLRGGGSIGIDGDGEGGGEVGQVVEALFVALPIELLLGSGPNEPLLGGGGSRGGSDPRLNPLIGVADVKSVFAD